MLFFEAFGYIKPSEKLKNTFADIEIIGIEHYTKSKELHLKLKSPHFIEYRSKLEMQKLLTKNCSYKLGEETILDISYSLSDVYNLGTVYKNASEYIQDEFNEKDRSFLALFQHSEFEFDEEKRIVFIKIEDSKLYRAFSNDFCNYFKKFYENCGMTGVEIIPEYVKVEHRDIEEYNEEEILAERRKAEILTNAKKAGNRAKESAEEKEEDLVVKEEGELAGVSMTETKPKKEAKPEVKVPYKIGAGKNTGNYTGGRKGFSERKEYGGQRGKDIDPDYIYGRIFEGETTPIHDIVGDIGKVIVRGKVLKVEEKLLRSGKSMLTFAITDYTDSISVKIFVSPEDLGEVKKEIDVGKYLLLKGLAKYDDYSKELGILSVEGIKKIPSFEVKRKDTYPKKRVELHLHTSYSEFDALPNPKDIVKTAFNWGMPAVAITDHGDVQAFPVANRTLGDMKKGLNEEETERLKKFKVIYGMEAYLVDDLVVSYKAAKEQEIDCPAVVFDIETTGFSNEKNKIIEIGAVKVIDGKITDKYSTFINPGEPIPFRIQELTHISDAMVADAPDITTVIPQFLDFCEGCILVGHNANFDVGFIRKNANDLGMLDRVSETYGDTMEMARILLPELSNYKLDTVAEALNCVLESHHRAVDDAGCTADIYVECLKKFKDQGIKYLKDVNNLKLKEATFRRMRPHHCTILVKNEIGRINLYHLVSDSNLKYMSQRKKPLVPKSNLIAHREGLIVGSACSSGELFDAVERAMPMEEIKRIADFYDYFEIMPLGNNQYLIDDKDQYESGPEDLIELNKRIIRLGDELGKLVVATGDVHFMNPEDAILRSIVLNSKKKHPVRKEGQPFPVPEKQGPLYFHTTEEMLKEFSYLGEKKAEEVVITNTNKIADMIEKISPVYPDKCAPVIPHSDEILRKICYDTAHKQYGPELPPQVSERLEHELNSIISNGFAVMYIIAQKLVWKSNEDGYLVGSRGSVGSSFVANMSGITEVNSLPPHYYCANCHYADFDSEAVQPYMALSGCDMPDRVCPKCGKMLIKDGHNIPFETFLGFNGDKEPDIDLNFSGEYQPKAHAYTEVIFGAGQTFRAGTIEGIAEKTAYGYVLKYNEDFGITNMRPEEVERLATGIIGVKTTTGQHPGGIVVMPIGYEIETFTPVQHPPKDDTHITTHFEYHSIDHNLLKLDILGHDDPTMIRFLEDITGVNAKDIRFDDKKVLGLFESPAPLGITSEDIDDVPLGSLGIPEMGTNFVMQMLKDTKPQAFSDLIRISGLSHGTGVWLGNVQELILQKKCTLQTAICTRDDIMTCLIQQYHLENDKAFKIMEAVRKGKGLKDEWMEPLMVEKGVPDWYIWSCKQIGYMFPKAHACAYVMMALRIAYFKVYYPLAYYSAYFSIRAKQFDYEKMALGKEHLLGYINDYNARKAAGEKLKAAESNQLDDMHLVLEMYARGFKFAKIDLKKVHANNFQIMDEHSIMPALSTVAGVGGLAAEQIIKAFRAGRYVSQEEFGRIGKIGDKTLQVLDSLGILGDLPKTSQTSIFDFIGTSTE